MLPLGKGWFRGKDQEVLVGKMQFSIVAQLRAQVAFLTSEK